jgi:hypothetical protein
MYVRTLPHHSPHPPSGNPRRLGYPPSWFGERPQTTDALILAELQRQGEILQRLLAIVEERQAAPR